MPTDSPELLLCPFCGETLQPFVDGVGRHYHAHQADRPTGCLLWPRMIYHDTQAMIDKWNRRPQQPTARGTLAELGKMQRERDEARECVRRLYPLAGMLVDQLAHEAKQPMTGSKARKLASELQEARAALAATPEHLRGQ